MSRISPKLIDVDGNRLLYDEETYNKYKKLEDGYIKKYEDCLSTYNMGVKKKFVLEVGRFPTQLFTNINDEKYKYVIKIK